MIVRLGDLLLGVGILISGAWLLWRFTRGTTLFFILIGESLLLGIIFIFQDTLLFVFTLFLLFGVLSEVWFEKIRSPYPAPQAILEGGGIRRGLTPIEIAEIMEISDAGIVTLGLCNLLEKKFIILDSSNFIYLNELLRVNSKTINPGKRKKIRQQAALEMGKTLRIFEEYLLALLEEKQTRSLSEIRFQTWLEYFHQYAQAKIVGYDLEKTRAYYFDKIKHTINHNPSINVNEWIVLAAIAKIENVFPADELFENGNLIVEKQRINPFQWIDRIYHQIIA